MTDWQHALTAQVAHNIEHFRTLRGLTRTQLANRCTDLGLPTKRPALAALLGGRRQTITLQELVVFAEALDSSLAELTLPLHTGHDARTGPTRVEHPLMAARRLFALPDDDATSGPYATYLRFQRSVRHFERANQRLAMLSHRLASGDGEAHIADGHPHPATEILTAEAALSRLFAARAALEARATIAPPLPPPWDFLQQDTPPHELPVLDLLPNRSALEPLYVYRLRVDQLPEPRLVGDA